MSRIRRIMMRSIPDGIRFPVKQAAAVLCICLITSCSPREKDPARRVLAGSLDAMGGAEKLGGWTTLVEEGTLTSVWPGWGTLKADCTHYTWKPDRLVWDQDYSAYDHPFYFVYSYNGGDAWVEVNLGIRQNPRYTEMLAKRMKEIDGLLHYYSEYDSFYIDTGVEDDSLFTAADITRIACVDTADTVFFDIDNTTHFPVRKIEIGDRGETHTVMSDYRSAGKLTVPYRITVYQNGSMTSDFVWEKIEYGAEIDPAVFEKNRPESPETG